MERTRRRKRRVEGKGVWGGRRKGVREYGTVSGGKTGDELTHVDGRTGHANMVDVSQKGDVQRSATAEGYITLSARAFELLRDNAHKKGDVLATARIAATMAAKQTSALIPLCHPLQLTHVHVELTPLSDPPSNETEKDALAVTKGDATTTTTSTTTTTGLPSVRIEVRVATRGPTGVEMEALTAVSVAALTIYDMCKAVQPFQFSIHGIRLLEKRKDDRIKTLACPTEQPILKK